MNINWFLSPSLKLFNTSISLMFSILHYNKSYSSSLKSIKCYIGVLHKKNKLSIIGEILETLTKITRKKSILIWRGVELGISWYKKRMKSIILFTRIGYCDVSKLKLNYLLNRDLEECLLKVVKGINSLWGTLFRVACNERWPQGGMMSPKLCLDHE